MLLRNLLEEYLLDIKLKNYSERTIKSNKNLVGLFITYLEEEYNITKVEEVSHIHIKAYIALKQKQGRKPSYINTILKGLNSFYNYLQAEDYVRDHLPKKIKFQKEDKTLIKTFTDEEVRSMIECFNFKDYMNARNRCIMTILADTGVRNFELCKITLSDIKENCIRILGKGKKERYVPITPYLQKTLLKYMQIRSIRFKDYGALEPLFLSYRAKPLTIEAVERVVKLAGELAKVRKDIRCSPHTLRHYYCQAQLRNGLDVYSLSRVVGHEDISITKRYLQSIKDADVLEMAVKTSPLNFKS